MTKENKKILLIVGLVSIAGIYLYSQHRKKQQVEAQQTVLTPENAADVIDIVAAQAQAEAAE